MSEPVKITDEMKERKDKKISQMIDKSKSGYSVCSREKTELNLLCL